MWKFLRVFFTIIGVLVVVLAIAVGVASLINKTAYVDQFVEWWNLFLGLFNKN